MRNYKKILTAITATTFILTGTPIAEAQTTTPETTLTPAEALNDKFKTALEQGYTDADPQTAFDFRTRNENVELDPRFEKYLVKTPYGAGVPLDCKSEGDLATLNSFLSSSRLKITQDGYGGAALDYENDEHIKKATVILLYHLQQAYETGDERKVAMFSEALQMLLSHSLPIVSELGSNYYYENPVQNVMYDYAGMEVKFVRPERGVPVPRFKLSIADRERVDQLYKRIVGSTRDVELYSTLSRHTSTDRRRLCDNSRVLLIPDESTRRAPRVTETVTYYRTIANTVTETTRRTMTTTVVHPPSTIFETEVRPAVTETETLKPTTVTNSNTETVTLTPETITFTPEASTVVETTTLEPVTVTNTLDQETETSVLPPDTVTVTHTTTVDETVTETKDGGTTTITVEDVPEDEVITETVTPQPVTVTEDVPVVTLTETFEPVVTVEETPESDVPVVTETAVQEPVSETDASETSEVKVAQEPSATPEETPQVNKKPELAKTGANAYSLVGLALGFIAATGFCLALSRRRK